MNTTTTLTPEEKEFARIFVLAQQNGNRAWSRAFNLSSGMWPSDAYHRAYMRTFARYGLKQPCPCDICSGGMS